MIRIIFDKDISAADALKCRCFNSCIPCVVQKLDVNMRMNQDDVLISCEQQLMPSLKLLQDVDTSKTYSCFYSEHVAPQVLSDMFVIEKKLRFDTGETKVLSRDIYFTKAEQMIIKTLIAEKGRCVNIDVLADCAFVSAASIPVHVCKINRKVTRITGVRLISSKYRRGYMLDEIFCE